MCDFNDNPSSYNSIKINKSAQKKAVASEQNIEIPFGWMHIAHCTHRTQLKCFVRKYIYGYGERASKQHQDHNDVINPIKIELNAKHLMRDVIHFLCTIRHNACIVYVQFTNLECARAFVFVRCPCCLHVQVKCFLIVNKIRFNSISMLAHGKIIIVQDIIGVKSSILKSKHHRPLACCVSHLCLIDMLMHKAFILFWIPFVFSFSSFFFHSIPFAL